MNYRKFLNKTLMITLICAASMMTIPTISHAQAISETFMPEETARHEGTWLQWPHYYTYGRTYRKRLDATWVAMSKVLVNSEKVHIIAYNAHEKNRIQRLLQAEGIPLLNVSFTIKKTDDVWVRDNGPVFVFDQQYRLKITDWGFNGWGYDTPYKKDNTVPKVIAKQLGLERINLNDVVLEGGSVEIDGNGTLLATRSSILERMRNPDISEREMEEVLSNYLGVSNFIWLDGVQGGKEDITDTHIDGFARFGDADTLVTMNDVDLRYWGISKKDIQRLKDAKDVNGRNYDLLKLPLTKRDVKTAYGKNLGYKGSYVNYYVANNVVLVPEYNDPNDAVAQGVLQKLYPHRDVVGIDVRNLYENGGMIHCVTQQQPAAYF